VILDEMRKYGSSIGLTLIFRSLVITRDVKLIRQISESKVCCHDA
jgi:hypothetical protein